MLEIQDSRISYDGEHYTANCENCGMQRISRYKVSIRRMLASKHCRKCAPHHKRVDIPKNAEGKWVSHCPKCGAEQAYTRVDHARSSECQGWLCRGCSVSSKNNPVGDERRLYNKFRKAANNRGIAWNITFEDFIGCYTGECALTAWELAMGYGGCTASFDRIDSTKPYERGNVQWVHTMVNMSKNKYAQDQFISMCKAVADKARAIGGPL